MGFDVKKYVEEEDNKGNGGFDVRQYVNGQDYGDSVEAFSSKLNSYLGSVNDFYGRISSDYNARSNTYTDARDYRKYAKDATAEADALAKKAQGYKDYVAGNPSFLAGYDLSGVDFGSIYGGLNDLSSALRDEQTFWDQFANEEQWKRYKKFSAADYTKNADYDALSQYVSTEKENSDSVKPVLTPGGSSGNIWQQGPQAQYRYVDTGFVDPVYDYINGNRKAAERIETQWANDLYGNKFYLAYMTDAEKKNYNYLHATNPAEADEYLEYLKKTLEYRQQGKTQEDIDKIVRNSFGDGLAMNAISLLSGANLGPISIAGVQQAGYQLADLLSGEGVDDAAMYNILGDFKGYVQGSTAEAIRENAGDVAAFGYQSIYMLAENGLRGLLSGVYGAVSDQTLQKAAEAIDLTAMASSVASPSIAEAKRKGYDDGRAVVLGLWAAATEVLTEKIGIDALFDKNVSKNSIRYIFKNFLSEAAEEGLADWSNLAADSLYDWISGQDKSEWKTLEASYMASGMSKDEATAQVIIDKMKESGMSALQGGISGLVFGGIGAGKISSLGKSVNDYGSTDYSYADSQFAQILDIARQSESERAQALAEDITNRMEQGRRVSNFEAGELAMETQNAEYEAARQRMADIAKSDIGSVIEEAKLYNETKADAVNLENRIAKGKAVTDEQAADIYEKLIEVAAAHPEAAQADYTDGPVDIDSASVQDLMGMAEKLNLNPGDPFADNGAALRESIKTALASNKDAADDMGYRENGLASPKKAAETESTSISSSANYDAHNVKNEAAEMIERFVSTYDSFPESVGIKIRGMARDLNSADEAAEYAYGMMQAYADGLASAPLQVYNGINQAQAEAMYRLGAENKEAKNGQEERQSRSDGTAAGRSDYGGEQDGRSQHNQSERPSGVARERERIYRGGGRSESERSRGEAERSSRKLWQTDGQVIPAIGNLPSAVETIPGTGVEQRVTVVSRGHDAMSESVFALFEANGIGEDRVHLLKSGAKSGMCYSRSNGGIVSWGGVTRPSTLDIYVSVNANYANAMQLARHELCEAKIIAGELDYNEVLKEAKLVLGDELVDNVASIFCDATNQDLQDFVCDCGGMINHADTLRRHGFNEQNFPALFQIQSFINRIINKKLGGKLGSSLSIGAGFSYDDADGSAFADRFSADTWYGSDYVKDKKRAAAELAGSLGISREEAERYIDDVTCVAAQICADRNRLDYKNSGLSPFVGNVEYGGSVDFDTDCTKRILFTGTFTEIQRRLPNSVISREEYLKIRDMMVEAGLTTFCGKCYVEGSRAAMGEFAAEFRKLYAKYFPDMWQPNQADLTTPAGVDQMRIEHPTCYEQYEYFWNNHGTLRNGDKAIFASQQKPKMFQAHSAYNGEILAEFGGKRKEDDVLKKNERGGIRFQSFSDFKVIHAIDAMQVLTDMARVALAGQAYTKQTEFAKAFGGTGLKINLSIDAWGVDENGKLIFNDVEGMDSKTAFAIRAGEGVPSELKKSFSQNVGTICVVYDDAMLMAALADPRVDFIIPFHRSQWKKTQYAAIGLPSTTKDYTNQQNEKWLNPKEHTHKYREREVPTRCTNYMPNEYWDFSKSGKENAEAYLAMCYRDGKRPKFYKLLDNLGGGKYALKADGSTDGYWKLLIDFKMYDNDGIGSPQNPVKPTFNMESINAMMASYTGGQNTDPVAWPIVDKFVEWYKSEHPADRYSASGAYAPTFYSQMARAVDGIKDAKIGAASVVSYLKGKGVKDEEIKWSGVEAFLDGKKSVTKQELRDFIAANELQIEEESRTQTDFKLIEDELSEIGIETDDWMTEVGDGYLIPNSSSLFRLLAWAYEDGDITQERREELFLKAVDSVPRWAQWRLDGGANYRELLFRMPGSEYSNSAMKVHWDKNGVLAHARMQDMDTASGDKMLFVEEIQSDWHNSGRAEGYSSKRITPGEMIEAADARDLKLVEEFASTTVGKNAIAKIEQKYGWNPGEEKLGYVLSRPFFNDRPLSYYGFSKAQKDALVALNSERNRIFQEETADIHKTPDAPFRDTYTDFVLKRLLRMAAEEGYDSIGWTTAEQQSERWSDEYAEGYRIEYDQDIPKFLNKYGKKWGAKVTQTELENGETVWEFVIPQAMKDSVLYEGQARFSTALDAEYMELAKDPEKNEKRLREMAEQAARDAGYDSEAWHGTVYGGFTSFDTYEASKYSERPSVASWFSDSEKMAERVYGTRKENAFYPLATSPKVYHVAINTEGFLRVDAKGRRWNDIAVPDELKREAINSYKSRADYDSRSVVPYKGKPLTDFIAGDELGYANTENFAAYAKANGFNGVVFSNIVDGDVNQSAGTVYAVFDSKSVKSLDPVTYDDAGNIIPLSERFKAENEDIRCSRVTDESLIRKLDAGKTITVYRAMQIINGKLYPPMAAAVGGNLVDGYDFDPVTGIVDGHWEQADERPDLVIEDKGKYYFKLDKGVKDDTGKKATDVRAAYNPYMHSSRSPINDQFKSAWIRSNLVTVEVEIPASELTSGYRAQYAKDAVGEVTWKSGSVSGQLAKIGKPRKVILSRYDKPVRVLSDSELAERMAEVIGDSGIAVPENTVTPRVLAELKKLGVKIAPPEKGVSKTEQIAEAIAKGLNVDKEVRFSTDSSDTIASMQMKLKDTDEYIAKYNRKAKYWQARTEYKAPQIDANTIKQSVNAFQKINGEYIDPKAAYKAVRKIAEALLNGEADYAAAREMARDAARDIINDSTDLMDYAKERLNYIKGLQFIIREHDKANITDYNAWRRKYFGKLNVRLADKIGDVENLGNADTVYEEMLQTYPDLAPEGFPGLHEPTDNASVVQFMGDLIDALETITENPYDYDRAEATELITSVLLDSAEQSVVFSIWSADDRLRKAGEQIEEIYERPLRAAKEAMEKSIARKNAQYEALKQHYRDVKAAERLRKQDSAARQKLLKIVRRLRNAKLPAVTREKLAEYIDNIDAVALSMTGKKASELRGLQEWLEDITTKGSENYDPNFELRPGLTSKIDRLKKVQIKDMTAGQVAELTEILLGIENEFRTERKMINSQMAKDLNEAAWEVYRDLQNVKGADGKLTEALLNATLSPVRFMHRATGFVDSDPLYIATVELQDGQRAMQDYIRRGEAFVSEFTNDKEFINRIQGKKAKMITVTGRDIETKQNVQVQITPAMRMTLYMYMQNPENLKHITDGAVKIPDAAAYAKGDMSAAYSNGRNIKFSLSQLIEITSHMEPKELAFCKAVRDYYDFSTARINETSEALLGYSLATVENYFPIDVNKAFLSANFEDLKMDGTIEGMGFTKERVSSQKPAILYDINMVVNRSIQQHAKYCGLAIPVRNFSKLWGRSLYEEVADTINTPEGRKDVLNVEPTSSVQEAFEKKWTKEGAGYVTKLMSDLQNPRAKNDALSRTLNAMRSNYAGGVLELNLSVAMKQAASYPTAAAVLGWKPLGKALNHFAKNTVSNKAMMEYMAEWEEYTPDFWYRARGFSNVELGDIASKGKHLPEWLNWIQKIDLATTAALMKASEYYVRDLGTYETGTEEYKRAVADVYNRVIEETQPNYSIMQRPQVLRSENEIVRALNMFKTQPYQNFNILADAIMDYRAKQRQFAAVKDEGTSMRLASAKNKLKKAVSSQVISAFVFALMQFAWDTFRDKKDKYKDDDEETAWSWFKGIVRTMAESGFGMIPFGSAVSEFIESYADKALKAAGMDGIFDQAFYGMEVNSVDMANSMLEAFGDTIADTVKVLAGGMSAREYLERTFDHAADFATYTGIPVNNVRKLFEAIKAQLGKIF